MIVESMSLKEVNDQMVKDMPLLQEWAEWKIGYELRSKFAHSKVYPCYAFRTWRSPMTNTLWHILFYCKEKKKANTPVALFYVKYDSDNGKGAYSYEIIGGNFKTVKYLAHFFARFRQRYIEPNHIDISTFPRIRTNIVMVRTSKEAYSAYMKMNVFMCLRRILTGKRFLRKRNNNWIGFCMI